MIMPDVAQFCAKSTMIIQAWDTAFSATSKSDRTVCVTMMLLPCNSYHRSDENEHNYGPCDEHFDVYILDVLSEKATWGDITTLARGQYYKWKPQKVIIEKRNYGVPLIENLESLGIPLEPVNPVSSKKARAVEGVSGVAAGSVQGWFKMRRVQFPNPNVTPIPWLEAYERELKDFTGEAGARDDQVDATVYGVQYAITLGSNHVNFPEGWRDAAQVDARMTFQEVRTFNPETGLATFEVEPDMQSLFDPNSGTCGQCQYYGKNIKSGLGPKFKYQENMRNKNMDVEYCYLNDHKTMQIGTCFDHEDIRSAKVY